MLCSLVEYFAVTMPLSPYLVCCCPKADEYYHSLMLVQLKVQKQIVTSTGKVAG